MQISSGRIARRERIRLKLKYLNFVKKFARRRVAKANQCRDAPWSVNLTAALVELEETVIQT